MGFDMTIADLLRVVVQIAAVFISLTVHEFSHALSAYIQGDMTARDQGRLTLNPIAHIDLVGTVLVPGILLLSGSRFLFGWAKPVPFNPYNLRNGRYGSFLVGVAGPLSNILLFACAGLMLKLTAPFYTHDNFLILFLSDLCIINFVLALFNLLPIPPLDGSKVLFGLLPPRYERYLVQLESMGPIIMVVFFFFGLPIVNAIIRLLLALTLHAFGIPIAG